MNSEVSLDNPETLTLLIEQNRQIVAPLLQDSHGTRSNFKEALQSELYPPSMDILKNNRRSLLIFFDKMKRGSCVALILFKTEAYGKCIAWQIAT